jgi:hypothetical protein
MIESDDEIKGINALRKFLIGDSHGYLWEITIDKGKGIGSVNCISGIKNYTNKSIGLDGSEFRLNPASNLHHDMQFLTTIIETRFRAA